MGLLYYQQQCQPLCLTLTLSCGFTSVCRASPRSALCSFLVSGCDNDSVSRVRRVLVPVACFTIARLAHTFDTRPASLPHHPLRLLIFLRASVSHSMSTFSIYLLYVPTAGAPQYKSPQQTGKIFISFSAAPQPFRARAPTLYLSPHRAHSHARTQLARPKSTKTFPSSFKCGRM